MKWWMKWLPAVQFCFFSGLIIASCSLILISILILKTADTLPKLPEPLSRIIEVPQSRIYASNGQVLLTLGERKPVPLAMVSSDFIDAIIATEDHRFFEHRGINKLRTLKALYVTLFESGRIQGASTITQQLAKNLFFSFEKTWARKFKELLVAFQIEASSTKEEILHAYINQIHFGGGAQGVEKAAQVFFAKPALELTLSESALLAGMLKSPTRYNPFHHYDRAIQRRDVVLKRMAAVGLISPLEARQAALDHPVLNQRPDGGKKGSYFLDALISELIQTWGEDVVYHGGIQVYASLDPVLQAYAVDALNSGLRQLDRMVGRAGEGDAVPQGAMVAIDAGTGAVKALVGGRDYQKSEFNRAMKARRQPGSGFKPFLYYTAFQKAGFNPATVVADQPVHIPIPGSPDWKPQNFGGRYMGNMVLKNALIHSVNTVAAQLVEKTGPEAVNRTASVCGIHSPLQDVYSTALGTSGVTPFEMAAAYSVFATLGKRFEPFLFKRIEDASGRVIYEHIIQGRQVLDAPTAYQVVDMMKGVIAQGSGRGIRKSGFDYPAAGKTGTTDGYNDAWFTGFTPTLSTSVWTGFDRNRKLVDINGNGITGGRIAALIWADFMKEAMKSEPVRTFPIPDSIRFETVDLETGCSAVPGEAPEKSLQVALKTSQQVCGEDAP